MKLCPICSTTYPHGHRTCPTHGVILVETPELPAGTMIRDCYRIQRMLGKGGMGTVYLAEHTLMGEPRALKFLASGLAANPTFVQRFLQEARAANKLRHGNIAQTMELGQTEDGSFYISMEYVDGPSLRALIEQAPHGLPPERTFALVRGIAEGLGAAHAKRMVHRDVKPENILLSWSGESETPKIVDFGIVAMADSAGRLTQTGRPILTAEYAAPEQWRGTIAPADLDGRTDLYALGCMFFEMLTGRLPFESETYEGWFEKHVRTAPPAPSDFRPELNRFPGLDALVLKLLAKEREDRPANVAEFLAGLDQVERHMPAASSFATPGMAGHPGPVAGSEPASAPVDETRRRTMVEAPSPYPAPHPAQPQASTGGGTVRSSTQVDLSRVPDSAVQPQAALPKQGKGMLLLAGVGALLLIAAGAVGGYLYTHRDTGGGGENQPSPTQPGAAQPVPAPPNPAQSAPVSPGQAQSGPDDSANPPGGTKNASKPTPGVEAETSAPNGNPGQPSAARAGAHQAIALFDSKQYAEALPLLTAACNAGNGESCDDLGWMYQHKQAVEQDYSRAQELFEKACNAKNMSGCSHLGFLYQTPLGVPQDYSRAMSLYAEACEGGFANGCNNLGYLYQKPLGVPQDYARAASLYDKACALGSYFACNNLGIMYQDSEGVTQSYAKAAALYGKACDGNVANGCTDLGDLYRTGTGVPKDMDKARTYLDKGCRMGNQMGCQHLKLIQ